MVSKVVWARGEERVEVNQRALIDKVLARYSGEFTVFRELLQNSDDARAKAVQIHFLTQLKEQSTVLDTDLKDLKKIIISRWKFRNNGEMFREEGWARLKMIAEGNPDEEKIGAFGVGFYSVFSVTEEPVVTSGGSCMKFFWKDNKNQLCVVRGRFPKGSSEEKSEWTTFDMPLREPAVIPSPFDLIRFLSSSITFMVSLLKVTVFLDDKPLAILERTIGGSENVKIPKSLTASLRTPQSTMHITSVQSTSLNIRAEVMKCVYLSGSEKQRPILNKLQDLVSRSIFLGRSHPSRTSTSTTISAPKDLPDLKTTSISLSVYSANVEVKLNDGKLKEGLLRATQKEPPSKMQYQLIYTGHSEYEASVIDDLNYPECTGSIFQGLRADLDGKGLARVFIGHSTGQTTGMGGHMSARFIPTVERELIDLTDPNVSVWNKELLAIGGVLSRVVYESEIEKVQKAWKVSQTEGPDSMSATRASLMQRAIHPLKFFAFHRSTPSEEVSQRLEKHFFANPHEFPMMSSKGIKSCSEIRLPGPFVPDFLKNLPFLPDDILEAFGQLVEAMEEILTPVQFNDVLNELESRPLPMNEMASCLKWWEDNTKEGKASEEDIRKYGRELVSAAEVELGRGNRLRLSSIQTYVGPLLGIPTDGPLPDHVLPPRISKEFDPDTLHHTFGWAELTLQQWLDHICGVIDKPGMGEFDLTVSHPWAERVLLILARAWPDMAEQAQASVLERLRMIACIPTSSGIKLPTEAYLPNDDIMGMFPDLPILSMPSRKPIGDGLKRLLRSLEVKERVEIEVIIHRMMKTHDWNTSSLIEYLVSVSSTLTDEDMEVLRDLRAFSRERHPGRSEPGYDRYCAKDLYEPTKVFRKLGLDTIHWDANWQRESEEARLLNSIGLKSTLELSILMPLCASEEPKVHTTALRYLLNNISATYNHYSARNFSSYAYLPAMRGSKRILGTPQEVVNGPQWIELGFAVLHPEYQQFSAILQVEEHPSTDQLVAHLSETPPKTRQEAIKVFSAMSARISDFSTAQRQKLSRTRMVPVDNGEDFADPTSTWCSPSQCYLQSDTHAIYLKLFHFVDFGRAANGLLEVFGAKIHPNIVEIGTVLLRDPRVFFNNCEGPQHYIAELRAIARHIGSFSEETVSRMKRTPMLLAKQRKPSGTGGGMNLPKGRWDMTLDLKRACEIAIVDDAVLYEEFGDLVFAAPEDDVLEAFYFRLGSRPLSSLVKEEYIESDEDHDITAANKLKELVLERLPLFLSELTDHATRLAVMSSFDNLKVRSFKTLEIRKSLNCLPSDHRKPSQVSALARKASGGGPIEMWVSVSLELDYYEVALALNKLILNTARVNDVLLLTTILSTDLGLLKRRGFNVDRILERHVVEELGEIAPRSYTSHTLVSDSPAAPAAPAPRLPVVPTVHVNQAPKNPSTADDPTSNNAQQPLPEAATGARMPQSNSLLKFKLESLFNAIQRAAVGAMSRPQTSRIDSEAIKTPDINYSFDRSSCCLMNYEECFTLVEFKDNISIHVSREISEIPAANINEFRRLKQEPLERFLDILLPLCDLFKLSAQALHIFYMDRDLMSFNCNKSIFVNLQYFETQLTTSLSSSCWKEHWRIAYASWYCELAHEIAHFQIEGHGSEHHGEFSTIFESHLSSLARLLE
ncbi:hypothetical protein FA15DRAFT_761246 [Coprinopsis marcescibilis]|uniref:Sacsin/Nov domain-containing protein n=1 Tax=Coprinopsis marcescibilis TaxID=230819 RepID=A0A5C3KAZ0_COPMA|nr:hypothetical protein FA15DRAFT_761246 [Coprinopsis marcescibilis]